MLKVRLSSLFLKYGEENVRRWCRTLKLFRFFMAHPYPDDLAPDRFVLVVTFTSEKDLKELLAKLELSPTKEEGRSPFKRYNANHSSGWINLFGALCQLDVNKIRKVVTVTVAGTEDNLFKLEEETYQKAKQLEEKLKPLKLTIRDPPENDPYCIAPKFYPEIFSEKQL